MKFAIPALLVVVVGLVLLGRDGRAQAYAPCGTPLSVSAMPIPVWLNPDLSQYGTVSRAEMSRELDIALADWANLPDSNITFYRTDVPVNGWYPRFSINPTSSVPVGVANSMCPGGGYTQWMSVLNTYPNFDTDSADGITPGGLSLAMVFRHELGHMLGLQHSCDGPNSLMCVGFDPTFNTYGIDIQIDPDAQSAMAVFYGSGTPTPTPTPTATPTPTPTPPTLVSCERVATYSDGTVTRTPTTGC